jgi:hypothetical protein
LRQQAVHIEVRFYSSWTIIMARRLKDLKEVKIERPPRLRLSAKESLKRTQEFDKRKEQVIASVRKGKS